MEFNVEGTENGLGSILESGVLSTLYTSILVDGTSDDRCKACTEVEARASGV